MKKKIFSIVAIVSVILSLTGCHSDKIISVNVENTSEVTSGIIDEGAMVQIGSGLYYDSLVVNKK